MSEDVFDDDDRALARSHLLALGDYETPNDPLGVNLKALAMQLRGGHPPNADQVLQSITTCMNTLGPQDAHAREVLEAVTPIYQQDSVLWRIQNAPQPTGS